MLRAVGESKGRRKLTRRRLFRVGIGGAVALGAGGIFAWQTCGYEVDEDLERRLRSLTPKEYLIVRAAAARILRPDGDDLPTADQVEAALFADGFVARMDEAGRDDLKKLLHVLEHALPVSTGRASRFTNLDGPGQDAVLGSMQTSSIDLMRGAFDGLKSLCAMAYFRDPRTWRPIGYDGPLIGRPAGGFR